MSTQKKLSRKELLEDDQFVEAAPDIVDWLEHHKAAVFQILAGGIVVVAGVAGWNWWSGHREQATARLLGEGLAAYHPETIPNAAPVPSRPSEALASFEKAAAQGGRSGSGLVARYYQGAALIELGRAKEAVPVLESVVADAGAPVLADGARALLARALEAAGDPDKAYATLKALADAKEGVFPPDMALLRMGELRARQGKTPEARQIFQEVVARYPQGQAAVDARGAIARLDGAAQ